MEVLYSFGESKTQVGSASVSKKAEIDTGEEKYFVVVQAASTKVVLEDVEGIHEGG